MISHVNCFIHSDDLVLVLGTFTLSGRRGPSVVLRKQEQGGEILIRMLIAETADEWNVRQCALLPCPRRNGRSVIA